MVTVAINAYFKIQNKLMQNHVDGLKSRYEDFTDDIFSAINAANVLCQLLKQEAAPDVETDVFDGNLLNHFYFMSLLKKRQ